MAAAHTDGSVLGPSICLDGVAIEENGRYVHPELVEICRELGVAGYWPGTSGRTRPARGLSGAPSGLRAPILPDGPGPGTVRNPDQWRAGPHHPRCGPARHP
ncbi:hypothetical protein OG520_36500 [Streptomyces sp. NBC_00984]|uniref:hypothetical protein n=1 Tax=Streptomyces sp. NBC_00984 TaxID=2903700 RepID=UPI00386401BB|nr:hypothetical protein OG520_36500 [Streptomyces sp. NBC_00984]